MNWFKKYLKKILLATGILGIAYAGFQGGPTVVINADKDTYIKVPVIGTGTEDDPYRPDLPVEMIEWSAHIPTDDKGVPLYPDVYVLISEGKLITTDLQQAEVSKSVVEQDMLIRDPKLNDKSK